MARFSWPQPTIGRFFYATSHSEPTPQSGVNFFSTEKIIKYM